MTGQTEVGARQTLVQAVKLAKDNGWSFQDFVRTADSEWNAVLAAASDKPTPAPVEAAALGQGESGADNGAGEAGDQTKANDPQKPAPDANVQAKSLGSTEGESVTKQALKASSGVAAG